MASGSGDSVTAVVLVQARMGSSRLPGKSLMALAGRPVLEHVLERAVAAGVGPVRLVTSVLEQDQALVRVAAALGVRAYTGSEWDVLERMATAACDVNSHQPVVRITGDCPFLDPGVLSNVVAAFRMAQDPDRGIDVADYVSNDTTCSGFPDGTDVEVFTASALRMADIYAVDRKDREHVTSWIRRHKRCGVHLCVAGDYTSRKLSIDRREDLELAQRMHKHLRRGQFSLADTMAAYEAVEKETA